MSGANTGVTAEQLQEILKTVIAEVRKPPEPTPEEVARKEQDLAMRRAAAEEEIKIKEGRRAFQKTCTHMQPNGTSASVSVNGGDFLICQHCQAKIKRFKGPHDEDCQEFIYDENLYWRLIQASSQTTF